MEIFDGQKYHKNSCSEAKNCQELLRKEQHNTVKKIKGWSYGQWMRGKRNVVATQASFGQRYHYKYVDMYEILWLQNKFAAASTSAKTMQGQPRPGRKNEQNAYYHFYQQQQQLQRSRV